MFLLARIIIFFLSLISSLTFAQEKSEIITLGVTVPLSGDFANYGEHIQRGTELAKDDLKKLAIDIQVVYQDACLPTEAVSAITSLLEVNKIKGLAANYCVIAMVPMTQFLEQKKVPAFHTSVLPRNVLAPDYVFTTNARIRDEAEKIAEYGYFKLKVKKAAVLYLTTQWGEEYNQAFVDKFKSLGGEVVAEETNPIGVNNFRSELTRIRLKKPDLIFMVHVGPTLGIAMRESRELGMKQPILTVNEAEEQSVIDTAKEIAEGLTFYAPEPKKETVEMKKFKDVFITRYNQEPHPLSRHSYDETIIIAQALAGCKLDGECAKNEIYKIQNYSGASGVFSFEPDGGVRREFVLKTVRNGKFLRAE